MMSFLHSLTISEFQLRLVLIGCETAGYALVTVMTLGGGGTRDLPGSFVKEHVTHHRQFVILRFPSGGKFAITAHVEILVLFLQKLHRRSEGHPWLKWVTRN